MESLYQSILVLKTLILSLEEENKRLKAELDSLREFKQSCTCKQNLVEKLLKTDADVLFYTGFKNLTNFNKMAEHIGPYVRQLWLGPKRTSTEIKRNLKSAVPKRFGPPRKLSNSEQFLFLMMKLRIDPPLQDLSTRFNVSLSTGQRIFSSWVRTTAKVMSPLVYIPDQGFINATRPPRFASYPNLSGIADCFELFIQTPKDPILQRLTWSSYKHHNTLKFFASVAPNSMVTFVSKSHPGSISDKELTNYVAF